MDGLRGLPLTRAGSAYLEKRGLLEVATDLGFGSVPDSPSTRLRQYAGRLIIPSIGPRDNVYDVAFRCVQDHDCKSTVLYVDKDGKERTCPKYLFIDGLDKRLYNLGALTRADDVVEITEGQLDAATLQACGLHAVGVAGANGWKRHHHRLFQGFPRVRVWGDGDVSGREFAKKIAHDVAFADVMMVPWEYDVNKLYVEQGKAAVLAIADGEDEDDHDDDGWPYDSERPGF